MTERQANGWRPVSYLLSRMADLHANFLRDAGYLFREQAEAAARDCVAAKGTDDAAFQAGRAMAYYEVASLLAQQSKVFELPLEDIAFVGFEPERLLK